MADYKGSIDVAAVSPDGSLGASNDGSDVLVWRLDSTAPEGRNLSSGDAPFVPGVAISPDGATMATGDSEGLIQLWDARSLQPRGEPMSGHGAAIRGLAFSPDSRRLASASDDAIVRLWDAASGQPIGEPLEGHTNGVLGVAFSPDGTLLATHSTDTTVRLWSAQTGEFIREIRVFDLVVHDVAFSSQGKSLMVTNQTNAVYEFDVASGELLGELQPGHSDQIYAVAVSRDGLMATGSGALDTTIRLWDVATGQTVAVLAGHTTSVWDVAFSPDGALLASTGDDGTVRLWDMAGRQLIATLQSHSEGYGHEVAFSPDGQWLASVGNDLRSYINIRDLNPDGLVTRACDLAGRNLTQVEWRLYMPEDLPYHKTCEQWLEGN